MFRHIHMHAFIYIYKQTKACSSHVTLPSLPRQTHLKILLGIVLSIQRKTAHATWTAAVPQINTISMTFVRNAQFGTCFQGVIRSVALLMIGLSYNW